MGTGDDEEESLEVTGPSGEQGGEQDMVEEEVQQVEVQVQVVEPGSGGGSSSGTPQEDRLYWGDPADRIMVAASLVHGVDGRLYCIDYASSSNPRHWG